MWSRHAGFPFRTYAGLALLRLCDHLRCLLKGATTLFPLSVKQTARQLYSNRPVFNRLCERGCCDRCGTVRTILELLFAQFLYCFTVARIVYLPHTHPHSDFSFPFGLCEHFFTVLLSDFLMILLSYRGNMQTTSSTFHLKDMVSVFYRPCLPLLII